MLVFQWIIQKYLHNGFTDFKIKFSDDLNKEQKKLRYLSDLEGDLKFRFDSNNSSTTVFDLIKFWRTAPLKPWALEEPVTKRDFAGMAAISAELDTAIILDESFSDLSDFEYLEKYKAKWIINLRVSRHGGILRSIEILNEAAMRNIPVIIGAHVGESGILTRAAITLSKAGGSSVIAREGAFGNLLLQSDPFRPVLTFGAKGNLNLDDYKLFSKPGIGLSDSFLF
jgi:L-alanine-DL-glutamate epimerase-like enolase superfamily enzyme